MPEPDQFKNLSLSSSFSELHRIEAYIRELKDWAGLSSEDVERLMLTLSEAVTNAMVHGNKENPDKQVLITASMSKDDQLLISIQDEGEGFDPDALPDPLKEENLLNEGGRGVYLIEHYADKVSYSDNGTKLTMIFDLSK